MTCQHIDHLDGMHEVRLTTFRAGEHQLVLTRGSSHLLLQRLHLLRALRDARSLLRLVSFQATHLLRRLLRLLLHGLDGARILRALVQLRLEPSRLVRVGARFRIRAQSVGVCARAMAVWQAVRA